MTKSDPAKGLRPVPVWKTIDRASTKDVVLFNTEEEKLLKDGARIQVNGKIFYTYRRGVNVS